MTEVLTLILEGGKGTRLDPLTRDRAKPAVPFGGLYRIIDFTLSNCINSNLRRILVLTQYKARSLDRHIAAGWARRAGSESWSISTRRTLCNGTSGCTLKVQSRGTSDRRRAKTAALGPARPLSGVTAWRPLLCERS